MGTPPTVSALLRRGADVHARNAQAETPLHLVLDRIDLDAPATTSIIQLLVAAGAHIHSADAQGRTPLALASDSGKPALVAALDAANVARS